jgi:Transposase DDE domain
MMVGQNSAEQLSIDGKTLRGSRSVEGPATHCVSLFCNTLTAMVGQVSSKGKGLEIPDALRLLEETDLKGIIVTGDAMFTQVELTRKIVDKGGDYVLPVKNNQAGLKDAVELALNDPCLPKKTLRKRPMATMAGWKNGTLRLPICPLYMTKNGLISNR